MNQRWQGVVGLLLLLTLVVLARTLWLQTGGPTRWSQKARQQQTENLADPPKRGRLLDRKGRVLVDHVPRFLLRWQPEKPNDVLPQELESHLSPPLRARLERGQTAAVETDALPAVSELVSRTDALTLQQISTRAYPHATLACHALGYIREEEISNETGAPLALGVDGLEAIYDTRLQGRQGRRTLLVSATGVPLGLVSQTPPQDGPDLITTLDLELQKAAESALDETARYLGSRHDRRPTAPGVALMMDPIRGDVLVMAGRPAFDPSLFQKGDERLLELLKSPQAPLINRAIAGLYPPASTFKLVTATAVLRHHPEWAKEHFYCTGSRTIGETVFHCFVTTGHGGLTFEEAIAVSCDTVFYDLATRMPVQELVETAKDLSFGQPTGIDLPGESAGHLPDPAAQKRQGKPWYAGDSANFGIGQGYMLATPLQVLVGAARLVGNPEVKPRLTFSSVEPSTQSVGENYLPSLKAGTKGALSYGTAAGVYVEGLELAGKTGTAEAPTTEDNPEGLNHTWFVAWAPAERPEVVALAFFEGSGGYGGEVAGPVVQAMLSTWQKRGLAG